MKCKILTDPDGFSLIEHTINQGILNCGFNTKEELTEVFPDSTLDVTYVNTDKVNKIYAIKNIRTNKLVYNKAIANPPHKFYEKLGTITNALNNYKNYYESKVKYADYKGKLFLEDNLPEDLKVVTYYLVEE